jgi:hypothetical protein
MRAETWSLLERYKVAYTIVDEPLLPPDIHLTSEIAYLRWHGKGSRPWYDYHYGVDELRPWAPKVEKIAEKAKKVYGYFNNHYHGYAVENCLQIMEMMGSLEPKQMEAKLKIENFRKGAVQQTFSTLESFAPPKDMGFRSLLDYFVPTERLKRAEQIHDDELQVIEDKDEQVEAMVREYHITIDVEAKTITHDCADWARVSSTKKLCKHVAKLLLSIDNQRATKILRNLYDSEEAWQFKPFEKQP